jgi:hypothetical protein
MAKLSAEEPDALMHARPGPWEPWRVTARATQPEVSCSACGAGMLAALYLQASPSDAPLHPGPVRRGVARPLRRHPPWPGRPRRPARGGTTGAPKTTLCFRKQGTVPSSAPSGLLPALVITPPSTSRWETSGAVRACGGGGKTKPRGGIPARPGCRILRAVALGRWGVGGWRQGQDRRPGNAMGGRGRCPAPTVRHGWGNAARRRPGLLPPPGA